MVEVDKYDFIDLKDFALAHLFFKEICNPLLEWYRSEIKPLNDDAAIRISEMARDFSCINRLDGCPYPKTGRYRWALIDPRRYHSIDDHYFYRDDEQDIQANINWLLRLPIPPEEEVYVCWVNNNPPKAAVTRWQVFAESYIDFWGAFEVMRIFDQSCQWAVMFGPEDAAIYAAEGRVNPTLPKEPLLHAEYGPILLGGPRALSFSLKQNPNLN